MRLPWVRIWTFHQPVTVEEAAALLNFPRLHLVKLLQNAEIPSTGVGFNRRIIAVFSWMKYASITRKGAWRDAPYAHRVCQYLTKDENRSKFEDLMTYKKKWEELRHQVIVEMAQISQEAGLY